MTSTSVLEPANREQTNSAAWWEHYFESLWDERGGPLQSQLFMQALVANLAPAEKYWLAQAAGHLLDWGCATGEGTAWLAKAYPRTKVWGLDNSVAALAKAQARHPDLTFALQWPTTSDSMPVEMDAVFCSNCLEHFEEPLVLMTKHLEHCKSLYVALVPYKEAPLEEFHCFSFDELSFPLQVAGMTRVVQQVIDVDPRAWPAAKQLMVVYASNDYLSIRNRHTALALEKQKWDAVYESMPLVDSQDDTVLQAFHAELLALFAAVLPRGQQVLEAGCGGGSQSLSLAREGGYEVSLLDFSPNALDYARRLFELHGVPVQTVEADAFAISEPQADLVFNAGVLEHYSFDEQVRFVKGMASRSRRYVMVLIPNRACYWYWVWRVQQASQGHWPYGREVPLVDFEAVFKAAGLKLEAQAFVGKRWTQLFVEQLSGVPDELKALIGTVHEQNLVQDFSQGYLLAALASKPVEVGADNAVFQPTGPWRSPHLTELRVQADWQASLADALSGQIAAVNAAQTVRVSLDTAVNKAVVLERSLATAQERSLAEQQRAAAELVQVLQERHVHQVQLSQEVRRLTAEQFLAHGKITELTEQSQKLEVQAADLKRVHHAQTAEMQEQMASMQTLHFQQQGQAQESAASQALQFEAEATRLRTKIQADYSQTMAVSDWAGKMDAAPIKYGVKKLARRVIVKVWRLLPLSANSRYRLKKALYPLLQLVRPKLQPVQSVAGDAPSRQVESVAADLSEAQLPQVQSLLPAWLFFGVIDWHFRLQRPQHLAREMARRGERVFYLSNHFVDRAEPGFEVEQLDPELQLYQIRLYVPQAPQIYFGAPSQAANNALAKSLLLLVQRYAIGQTTAVIQHAYWKHTAFGLPRAWRLYDCMDHHAGFGDVPQQLLDIEQALLRDTDAVITSSQWLYEHASRHNCQVALIRNAADYEHFCAKPADIYKDPQGRQIIGYIGAIALWFDVALVRELAKACPDCLVLLVGNDTIHAKQALVDLPNVVLTGEMPYSTLPYYLHSFDVCLLPFVVTDLTLATNPVKVYEYLAAGKPCVSVDLPEMAQFGDLVLCADNPAGFVTAVQSALKNTFVSADKIESRKAFARNQTWAHRAAALLNAKDEAIAVMPKISVIVLTYNNLHLTRDCLDSILERSDYPNLELIVVDNASTDGTPAYLEALQHSEPRLQCILHPVNSGFSAGNNLGLAKASGDYLVILNNDTVVTDGWLLGLLRHFQQDAQLGLLGPVTNNIGNEARIDTDYSDLQHMPAQARSYTLAHAGDRFELNNLAFFCTMLTRDVYERCGGLCEDYGLGFFEDDDYCRRVQESGMKIFCAQDVFVHHHLSASFNKLGSAAKNALFEKNKAIYESKWGSWTPHEYKQH